MVGIGAAQEEQLLFPVHSVEVGIELPKEPCIKTQVIGTILLLF